MFRSRPQSRSWGPTSVAEGLVRGGVGKLGGKGLDSGQSESGCIRVARTLWRLDALEGRSLLVARLKAS